MKYGKGTIIGQYVVIENDVVIGDNCRILSHSFLCDRVRLGNDVFVGHGVLFCNDVHPFIENPTRVIEGVIVEDEAAIGSGAVILPGVTIGARALVGAGSVVTRDVAPGDMVAGNPARSIKN